MIRSIAFIALSCTFLFFHGFAQEKEPLYSLFLIGDAGSPDIQERDEVLALLKEKLDLAGENSGVIFLGDNIYPRGLPPPDDNLREQSEKILLTLLAALSGHKGDVFFIPGNHDWHYGRKDGREYVLRQEAYIENYFHGEAVFLPGNACPGPVEVNLTEEITLAFFDSQWLLQPWHKSEEENDCGAKNFNDVLEGLKDILNRNAHKKVIVVSHHPIFTYGPHGGVFTLKHHIFPFADLYKELYIPLPVFGSMYVVFRKFFGHVQDTSHPNYAFIRRMLEKTFDDYPNLIHAAGHDHSLQYSRHDSVHYIVSGAGSETSHVKEKKYARFAASALGFSELSFFSDGIVKLNIWTVDGLIYEQSLFKKPYKLPERIAYFNNHVNFSDSSVTVAAGKKYEASGLQEKLLGENYREVWSAPVRVPVFDISQQGGLEPVQKETGMATKLLRLESSDGRQFTLRPVDKNAAQTLPPELNGTLAADLAQDQVSASHPYAALAIPPLAKAAGIYHTNPRLVYIPDDPRLGEYRRDFAHTLAIFEERPYGQAWREYDSFGGPDTIVDYATAVENLIADNDYQADQRFIIRNRLFDLIIGDWDRGEDHWRWALFETDSGKWFRPVPVDRDQAFFVNEGLIPKIASRKWALPALEGFDHEVRWVEGFMFSGRYFDRFFLTEPSGEEWREVAGELQRLLSDSVIEEAFRAWPKEIVDLTGEKIISILKSRRDQLTAYASDYYHTLSEKVNVLGSHKRECIEINRLSDKETRVTVRQIKMNNEKSRTIYDRTFKTGETKEIRLYAFNGNDSILIRGQAGKGIKLGIIGGRGEDVIVDSSRVSGWSKKTRVYDKKSEDNEIKLGSEARNLISNRPDVHEYNPREFQYNLALPLVYGDYNSDDGLFIGAGALITTYAFRKDPFSARHLAVGKFAPKTRSTEMAYTGDFVDLIGRADIRLHADVRAPSFTANFYGLGAETSNRAGNRFNEVERQFYRIRSQYLSFNALLKTQLSEKSNFYVGPAYLSYDLRTQPGEDRFINDFENNGLDPSGIFERKQYAGAKFIFNLDTRTHRFFPLRGMTFSIDGDYRSPLKGTAGSMIKIRPELALYHSFSTPARLTLAGRAGGGIIFGDYEFFQANSLGGTENLRGFRINRFLGRYSFYNNMEVRLLLFRFKSYIAPGSFGILAFHDVGRVWIKGESSDKWRRGYGGGLWLAPMNEVAGSLYLGFSEEESFLALLKIGFFF